MKVFKIGETYTMNSLCDINCVWKGTVRAKTAKTITLKIDGDLHEKRVKLFKTEDEEYCFPLGRFSMAPRLRAGRR